MSTLHPLISSPQDASLTLLAEAAQRKADAAGLPIALGYYMTPKDFPEGILTSKCFVPFDEVLEMLREATKL